LRAHFVLICHAEAEVDEVTGGKTVTAATLGRKLGPKLGRFFSEVIHTKRDGNKFSWSTASYNYDLKTRYMSISETLEPSFKPMITKWRELAE